MTNPTAQMNGRTQDEAPISVIVTPNLSAPESARLLECMNKVRSGERVYYVRITYHKVTKAPARVPGTDYVADPGLRPNAHEGWLVEARINRKGAPYIRLHDEARRPDNNGRDYGFTCNSMEGIESFKVLGERPGPKARSYEAPRQEQPQAVQAQASIVQMAVTMQAQGMFMMGQAMVLMAQAMGQPMPQFTPPQVPPPVPQGPEAAPEAQPVT